MPMGRNIRKARIDRGLQQKQLTALVGITQKYMSEIELEKVDPRISVVQRIASALGVSLDRLAQENDHATP